MEAKELRIGNWIRRRSNGSTCTVNWGIIKDFVFGQDVYDYEPIPLTPEILEKCGFIREVRTFYKGIFFVAIVGEKCGFGIKNTGLISTFKYLHQLQNLFFSLTGEELKINL